ncbi:hypothetical protein HUJ05_012718, partial [Dendroctonus ponderosae]
MNALKVRANILEYLMVLYKAISKRLEKTLRLLRIPRYLKWFNHMSNFSSVFAWHGNEGLSYNLLCFSFFR